MPDPDRGPLQGIVKYNPHLWGDDELRSIFVARNRELTELLDRLRQTPVGKVPQHILVVGQRGMGKTTLLRRLALGVRDDPELSPLWIALTFPEEQFTVSTLAELWSNVLDALTDALETEGAPPAELDRLDGEIRRIGALAPLERENAAIGLLGDWIDQHQRRIVLLIDSTDLLFDSLGGPEEGKPGQKAGDTSSLWRLRKTLTHHSGFFWLGASYQALESGHLYSDAFHDFFELVELRPLSVGDMRQAMLALARAFGAAQEKPGEAAARAMTRILDAKPERLKILRNLAGGNPRTTVMLYELFATDRQDNLHADLKRLLDILTPLYKARMENLADQPRKLLAHVMEHWAPMAAAELAEASGIPATTVSGQLARLEAEGLIEKARLTGRRRAGYQIAERFFNIWYLMRYTPRRIRQGLTWLVEFMRLWYSADELCTLAGERARAHVEGRLCHADQLEYSRALAAALGNGRPEHDHLELSVFLAAEKEARCLNRPIPEIFPDLFDLGGTDKAFINKSDGWNKLGVFLQFDLNRPEEAEAAYHRAIEPDLENAWPWFYLGSLLQCCLGRCEEAEVAYRRAIEIDPKFALPWFFLGLLLEYRLDRPDEAEAAYRHARQLAPDDPHPAANHARLLACMGKRAEVSAAYRQAADLAATLTKSEGSADYWDILLQAHLYLGNRDSAAQALEQLANLASSGDQLALYKLREQARECHCIGLGSALAERMEQSQHANFLKPIALALRAAAGEVEALDGIPPELRVMAEEVMRDILPQDRKAVSG
jgi:tetratricopeptide (TPR) repeat protein